MTILRVFLFLLVTLALSACGSVKTYKEEVVNDASANLILEVKAKTFFSKELTASLFDYDMVESGKACKQKGFFSKYTSIADAHYGVITAKSKKPAVTKRIPANKPMRAYVEFYDKSGNNIFVNSADIVFLPKQGKTYKFFYKRNNFSSGNFAFLEKTRNGFKEIKNIGEFSFKVCDKYL